LKEEREYVLYLGLISILFNYNLMRKEQHKATLLTLVSFSSGYSVIDHVVSH